MVPSLLAAETVQLELHCRLQPSLGGRDPQVFRAVVQSSCQESCHASASGSCLHLDGSLHFSRAALGVTRSPLHWSPAGAMLLLLSALLP